MIARTTYGVERLGALSDGVFAIVFTLLVLDLGLPDPPEPGERLLHELGENGPDFAAWLIAFVVLARFWTIHHTVLANMARCRTLTIVLNFAFLGMISLLPFSATLIGTYGFREPLPVVFFSAGIGLAGLALGLFTRHAATEPPLLRPEASNLTWHWRHHAMVIPLLALASIAMAFLHPPTALALWAAEALFLLAAALRRRSSERHPVSDPARGVGPPASPPREERPSAV